MKSRAAATPNTFDEAAQRVRRYILKCQLKPGDQLPIHSELSRLLKIGPRRLREGLSVLRHQGIIETRNGGGTIVCRPTVKVLSEPIGWHLDIAGYESEDLVFARACVESGVAAMAAEKRTARDLLRILDALERLEAIPAEQDDLSHDEAFHLAIMEATHNAVIVTFGQLVRLQFESKIETKPLTAKMRQKVNAEHRTICDAIASQDSAAARDLMQAHIVRQLDCGEIRRRSDLAQL